MNTALCIFLVCGALEKHLLTYLKLIKLERHNYVYNVHMFMYEFRETGIKRQAHRHSTTERTISASRTSEATNNPTVTPTEFVCDTTDVDVDVYTSTVG